uniref:Transmembrane protein n=1 Tax=Strongyloides papillosus TaxID=174720 RepID=A0A0N5CCK5_STREA
MNENALIRIRRGEKKKIVFFFKISQKKGKEKNEKLHRQQLQLQQLKLLHLRLLLLLQQNALIRIRRGEKKKIVFFFKISQKKGKEKNEKLHRQQLQLQQLKLLHLRLLLLLQQLLKKRKIVQIFIMVLRDFCAIVYMLQIDLEI